MDESAVVVVFLSYVAAKIYIAWVCSQKDKPVFAGFALVSIIFPFVIGWIALVGAIRIAKPNSQWAQQKYVGTADGERKMAIARQRFPSNVPVGVADLGP